MCVGGPTKDAISPISAAYAAYRLGTLTLPIPKVLGCYGAVVARVLHVGRMAVSSHLAGTQSIMRVRCVPLSVVDEKCVVPSLKYENALHYSPR